MRGMNIIGLYCGSVGALSTVYSRVQDFFKNLVPGGDSKPWLKKLAWLLIADPLVALMVPFP